MHTYIHTYIQTYIHTYIHTYTHIHTYIHTYITDRQTDSHACIHPYIHTSIQTDIHTYIHMHIYIYIHTYTYTYKHTYTFSQTVCPHSGVLTVRVEGRGFLGHIFSCEFSHKSSPVRCAFPLRRLAQARERGQGSFALRHFHSVNSRINVPFWDVHVHFDCAGSHRLGGASALWLSMCISGAWVYSCLYESSSGMLLWGSCISILFDPLQHQQVLLWWPCDIRVLAWRSWSRSFTIPWATRGSCRDHGEILSGVLAWSCTGPFGKSLWGSLRNAVRGLCMILCRSEVRSEIPYVSLHGLVQVLVTSSCGDCVGILLKRSLH